MARRLSDWIEGYLAYTKNTEPAYVFKVWNAITAISACLQRKCWLPFGMSEIYANVYVMLVGPSGAGKSYSMTPMKNLLRSINGVMIAADSNTREGFIRSMRTSQQEHINLEEGTMLTHSSILVFASELSTFLGYKNSQFIVDLCDIYDCGPEWEYRTKDPTKTDKIIKPYLTVMGGITPGLVQSQLPMEAIGGGLTARMFLVYAEKGSGLIPMPFLSPEQLELEPKLVEDLASIVQLNGPFSFAPDFIDPWHDFYYKVRKETPWNEKFDGYFSRRPLHTLKLCMILSASESNDMVLHPRHLKKAEAILYETEQNMPRALAGVGGSDLSKTLQAAMTFLALTGKVRMDIFHRKFAEDVRIDQLELIIQQMVAMGFCRTYSSSGGEVYIEYIPEEKEGG